MTDISLTLNARNSNGEQKLYLTRDGEEFFFTLTGEYKGRPIQIDFDEMTVSDLEDLKAAIELIIESDG